MYDQAAWGCSVGRVEVVEGREAQPSITALPLLVRNERPLSLTGVLSFLGLPLLHSFFPSQVSYLPHIFLFPSLSSVSKCKECLLLS